MKGRLVLTLHLKSVHVFVLEDADAQHLAAVPLSGQVADGYFLDNTFTPHGQVGATVNLFYQTAHGGFRETTITVNPEPRESDILSVKESTLKLEPASKWAHLWQLGPCGKVLFCLNSSYDRSERISATFASLWTRSTAGTRIDSVQIPEDNLPPLELISRVDFDDGNGLLLLSFVTGDVRLVSVLKEAIISPTGVLTDLGGGIRPACSPVRIYHVGVSSLYLQFRSLQRHRSQKTWISLYSMLFAENLDSTTTCLMK